MKLLYATSALYPSKLANRAQIFAMASAFHRALGDAFMLGVPAAAVLEAPFTIVRIPGSLKSIALGWRYARFIAREHITHVYCREERLLFFITLFSRMRGTVPQYFFEAHWIQDTYMFRRAVHHAHVIAITHALGDDLRALGVPESNITIAPDGVDLARYTNAPTRAEARTRYGIPSDAFVVGYTGSFTKHHDWKGVDTLLAAAPLMPEAQFWLVGGAPEEVAALQSEVPANVRLEGFVEAADIPSVQVACDVLVLPTKKGSTMAERHTSPLKLFEYMASGTPIIASDLPSAREVLTDATATWFVSGEAASLRSAIAAVQQDVPAAHHRALAALEAVRAYTWDARASAIIQVMRA
ncbi:MAG TPA: glycosyltransferase [Candidatus Paceibacterota bacterium]|nr:glycosyltransferase [Candidatus Paceibacterota bacterium]